MKFTFFKFLLNRKEVKIIIIGTVTGGVFQILCRRYLRNHPELLETDGEVSKELKLLNNNRKRWYRRFVPRGGALIEISGISIKVLTKKFIAKKGLLAGLATGSGIVLSKIPTSAISTYLLDSFPQNLLELEKKKFILVNKEKIYLDQCDEGLEYLFKILKDEWTCQFRTLHCFYPLHVFNSKYLWLFYYPKKFNPSY